MQGLKQKLNEVIKLRGYVTLQEAYNFGAGLKAKQKTVERTLNPSISPDIYTHKNHRHQITGYSWKPKPKLTGCCSNMISFNSHFGQACENQKEEKKVGQLF